MLSKGVALTELADELGALVHRCDALLDVEHRRTWVTLLDDALVLIVFLADQRRGNDVLLVVGEVEEKPHPFKTFPVLVVIMDYDLLYCLPEGLAVYYPKAAGLSCLHR